MSIIHELQLNPLKVSPCDIAHEDCVVSELSFHVTLNDGTCLFNKYAYNIKQNNGINLSNQKKTFSVG